MKCIKLILFVCFVLLVIYLPANAQTLYPVIFVHGIGDSSVAWKETGPAVSNYLDKCYKTPDHPYFSSGSGIGKSILGQSFAPPSD